MIELTVDEFKNGKVTFHISRQDKEDYEKLRGNPFPLTLSDGKEYRLYSINCPDYINYIRGELFVRGTNSEKDNTKMIAPFAEFLRIFELVKEYNKTS